MDVKENGKEIDCAIDFILDNSKKCGTLGVHYFKRRGVA
jgi:hypothetical protein